MNRVNNLLNLSVKALFVILLMGFLGLHSCKSPEYMTEEAPSVSAIHFGDGGGFAGIEKEWVITEDAALFQWVPAEKKYQFVSRTPKNETQQLFAAFHTIGFFEIPEGPGANYYEFIEWRSPESKYRVIWDRSTGHERSEIETLYYLLKKQLDHVQ